MAAASRWFFVITIVIIIVVFFFFENSVCELQALLRHQQVSGCDR
jgi:uncharacterized membrane protein YgaE (UPF0421/DUF939 family)